MAMRLFQILGIPGTYKRRLSELRAGRVTFDEHLAALRDDRFGASHLLKPVLQQTPDSFFTSGNDEPLQRAWARERGMRSSADLEEILLAQIEEHRTDVLYNLDPMRFDSVFVRKLPSSVKKSLCWRAAPSPRANFSAYDLVVCNFPDIIESWREMGFRSDYFSPAHDPEMDVYATSSARPVDVLFVGTFTRHHTRRNKILEAVAGLAEEFRIALHLDRSRMTRLAEGRLGILPPLRKHARPEAVQRVSEEPLFGTELYSALARSKVVLNGAIDMAGDGRGNMRCFEAMGAGALLVSDRGRYPTGMNEGETMLAYTSEADVANVLRDSLRNWSQSSHIADRGHEMIRTRYSKEVQWKAFQALL